MSSSKRLVGGALAESVRIRLVLELDTRGISRRQLAEKMGVTHTYLNSRFNGNIDFSITDVELICQIIDINLYEVFSSASIHTTPLTTSDPRDIIYDDDIPQPDPNDYTLAAKNDPWGDEEFIQRL